MPALAFEDVLRPTGLSAFVDQYFDRAPLHNGGRSSDAFEGLFSLEDLEDFLSHVRPGYAKAFAIDSRRAIATGEYADANGMVDPTRLFQLYAGGATIVLREVDAHFPTLNALCRSAEKALGSPFFANVYYAPPGGQSFPLHFDAPDVYVLQIEGSKLWRLFRPAYEKPLSDQHCSGELPEQDFLQDFNLAAGDFLYVPRGFPHIVKAGHEPSLHISLSTFPHTWADVLTVAMSELARRDAALRAAVPPSFLAPGADQEAAFAALARRFAEKATLRPSIVDMARRFVGGRPVNLEVSRRRPFEAAALTLESWLKPNGDALVMLEPGAEAARLTGLGKELMFAPEAADDLAFALQSPRYQIKDTPGAIAPENKIELFQTLLANGFVDLA